MLTSPPVSIWPLALPPTVRFYSLPPHELEREWAWDAKRLKPGFHRYELRRGLDGSKARLP
jgi:hypothetical protein